MKISIIVPVYNKQKYIGTTLKMIQKQSFADFECLLIDDGSTDDSGTICDSYSKRDSRFKVFHIKNGGVSHARNIGLDNAKGEYITFIDSDDEIHAEYLTNLYNCITEKQVDLVISGIIKFWDNLEREEPLIYFDLSGYWKMKDLLQTFAKDQQRYGIYGWCVAKIFSRKIIGKSRFDEDISLAEDLDFYLDIYPRIKTVFIDNHAYYYYRQESENSGINLNDDKIDYVIQLRLQIKIYHYLESMNALNNSNKELCQKRIDDYLFFAIYHTNSSWSCIDKVIKKISVLDIPYTGVHNIGISWRKLVLFLFYHNHILMLKILKKIYDCFRGMKRHVSKTQVKNLVFA